ncbi:MAG: transposon-encoded TnpW family protein [Eubacteriaceae bacterium]
MNNDEKPKESIEKNVLISQENISHYEIGNTLYIIVSHYSKTSKEGLVDKIARMIKNDVSKRDLK